MTDSRLLDTLVDTYRIDTVTEQYKRLEFVSKLSAHVDLENASVMELGSASGHLSALLADGGARVVAVDGSARFLEIARQNAGTRPIEFVYALFEELEREDRFDLLVMHHILEHVDAPVRLLGQIRNFLKPGGMLAVTVPNAYALSRQLAVSMGLLPTLHTLTENDHHHGHKSVYDWQALEGEVEAAGYTIVARHGLALKLFADFQNEQAVAAGIIGDQQLRGLWPLADTYRDIAGAIMIVAHA